MVSKARANTRTDKLARRIEIIEAALVLWERTPYEDLTMSMVANSLNLAKGTLYLYFPSKEELFLAVYVGLLDQWFDQVELGLEDLKTGTPATVAAILVEQLVSRPNLARLIPLIAGSLERNLTEGAAKEYKSWQARRIDGLGKEVEAKLPNLPRGCGAEACLYFHALAAGLGPMGDAVLTLKDATDERERTRLQNNFSATLKRGVTALIIGLQTRQA
jgi:TetR/AcrR family transcriptional regulator